MEEKESVIPYLLKEDDALVWEKTEKYFDLFSKKDLDGIQTLFSKDIILTDWEIKEEGFHNVVDAFNNIFNSCNEIDVTIDGMQSKINSGKIYCEIRIDIDNLETLRVVDVITFNSDLEITSIKAYKQ